jgi:tRNA-Thr(GGU) m(6)t(6)A37 methyltransferase TsaA
MSEGNEGDNPMISMTAIGIVRRLANGVESIPGRKPTIEALRAERVSIVLDPSYAAGLLGLEAGADILVLCYLDRADHDVLQVHPRGDMSRPLQGVFATRSPGRPNPISVTSARVLHVEGTTLHVTGLDVLDATPVLDIKSHSSYFDEPYDDT